MDDVSPQRLMTINDDTHTETYARWPSYQSMKNACSSAIVTFTSDWAVMYKAMLNVNIDRRIMPALSLIYATMQASHRSSRTIDARSWPIAQRVDDVTRSSSSSSISSQRHSVMTRNKTAHTHWIAFSSHFSLYIITQPQLSLYASLSIIARSLASQTLDHYCSQVHICVFFAPVNQYE